MNRIREITNINQRELELGLAGTPGSWHAQFEKAPWIYVGNLVNELTEGDILCVFSQFGEIEDIHLVREEDTGKSKGFAFIKYEDSRSCILAVDNFCGAMLCGKSLSPDHVENYRLPKKVLEEAANSGADIGPGLAYKGVETENKFSMDKGQDLFARPAPGTDSDSKRKKSKKHKKKADKKHKKKKSHKHDRGDADVMDANTHEEDDKDGDTGRGKKRKHSSRKHKSRE
mmetsp:Transcript_15734/g.43459  ORF Transcript_15734/g.43459 Transcript_15734/m.43459 type:complete len:229 (-) Transcript_15734:3-689(-)